MPSAILYVKHPTSGELIPVKADANGKLVISDADPFTVAQDTPENLKHVPHGYYAAGPTYLPFKVDADGVLQMSGGGGGALNDLSDVSVPAPADQDLFYYDDATSLWRSRALVDADIPAAIARDAEVTSAISTHTSNASAHHTKYTNAEAVVAAKADSDIADAISKKHARQHAITATADHTSAATAGKVLKADAAGLPVDATNTDTEVADAVTKKHTRAHAIDDTTDHSAASNNTNHNASATAHGLLPKLSNVVTEFLNGQGGFSVPAGGGGPTIVRKTADETVNNSTTLQDDNHLVLPVLANEIWAVFMRLGFSTEAGTYQDLKIGFTVPTGGGFTWNVTSNIGILTTTAALAELTEASTQNQGSQGGGVTLQIFLWGTYIGGANAGNLRLQWAQAVAEAKDYKMLTNSYIIAHKLN